MGLLVRFAIRLCSDSAFCEASAAAMFSASVVDKAHYQHKVLGKPYRYPSPTVLPREKLYLVKVRAWHTVVEFQRTVPIQKLEIR